MKFLWRERAKSNGALYSARTFRARDWFREVAHIGTERDALCRTRARSVAQRALRPCRLLGVVAEVLQRGFELGGCCLIGIYAERWLRHDSLEEVKVGVVAQSLKYPRRAGSRDF
jgi:hypothetical protein